MENIIQKIKQPKWWKTKLPKYVMSRAFTSIYCDHWRKIRISLLVIWANVCNFMVGIHFKLWIGMEKCLWNYSKILLCCCILLDQNSYRISWRELKISLSSMQSILFWNIWFPIGILSFKKTALEFFNKSESIKQYFLVLSE